MEKISDCQIRTVLWIYKYIYVIIVSISVLLLRIFNVILIYDQQSSVWGPL